MATRRYIVQPIDLLWFVLLPLNGVFCPPTPPLYIAMEVKTTIEVGGFRGSSSVHMGAVRSPASDCVCSVPKSNTGTPVLSMQEEATLISLARYSDLSNVDEDLINRLEQRLDLDLDGDGDIGVHGQHGTVQKLVAENVVLRRRLQVGTGEHSVEGPHHHKVLNPMTTSNRE